MDDLMDQFAIEARELVQQASTDLLVLEREPHSRAHLESAFRAIHTLKGSVGLFDFGPMHDVLHQAEDLLSAARSGTIDIDAGLIDPLIAVIEWVDLCLDEIVRLGTLSPTMIDDARGLLTHLRSGVLTDDGAKSTSGTPLIPDWTIAILNAAGDKAAQRAGLIALRYEPHPECFFNGDDPLAILSQVANIRYLTIAPRDPWPARADYNPFRCNLLIEALVDLPLAELETVFRLIPDQVRLVEIRAAAEVAPTPLSVTALQPRERQSATMRVDTARIDALVAIVGELITAKNGLVSVAKDALATTGDGHLSRRILSSHQEIERLVGALHTSVTAVRMIPLGHIFRRFPRMVRETASRLGKAVDLVVDGEAVEADREIVEEMFEPLMHLVRNALDHGIETEAERTAQGKPPRGTLSLSARQTGDRVELELKDDGRGIDAGRVRTAAIARGLITETEAHEISDVATLQLVFSAGFSTATVVSDLSGRGVGLDAVKAAAQRLGGHVALSSQPGIGTSFTLQMPISFAMSRLMVIEVDRERYGIPMETVIETQRIPSAAVMPVRAGEAFVLRGQTLPLLHLADLLKLPQSIRRGNDLRVLIVRIANERVGLVVDAIAERAETLMRPLSGLMRGLPGIAGTTLLGDGKILLVLNLEELIQ